MGLVAKKVTRGRRGLAARVLSLALLVAFALQSYATQIHIHATPHGTGQASAIEKTPANGKAPFENGTANCPFCQAIAHAGVFFGPAAPLLVLPAWAVNAALPTSPRLAVHGDLTRNWQSRAPPLR
jgi:hypothetical protein